MRLIRLTTLLLGLLVVTTSASAQLWDLRPPTDRKTEKINIVINGFSVNKQYTERELLARFDRSYEYDKSSTEEGMGHHRFEKQTQSDDNSIYILFGINSDSQKAYLSEFVILSSEMPVQIERVVTRVGEPFNWIERIVEETATTISEKNWGRGLVEHIILFPNIDFEITVTTQDNIIVSIRGQESF